MGTQHSPLQLRHARPHTINIAGKHLYAGSNIPEKLVNDLACADALGAELALNTFNLNIYNALYPNQFSPLRQSSVNAIAATALVRCAVPNAATRQGPHPGVFDFAVTSGTRKDLRRYIEDRRPSDAYECYQQLYSEVQNYIAGTLRKEAQKVRPMEGLFRAAWGTLIDGVIGLPGGGIGKWYYSQVQVPPAGAAAFLYDLERHAKED